MVKKICVLYSDGSMNVLSGKRGEENAIAEARGEALVDNRHVKEQKDLARVGMIEVDLDSFEEIK